MDSKIVFLLLSASVLLDLSTANKENVSVLCSLAKKNALHFPIAKRTCITGCFGDPNNHPLIVFNQCLPKLIPGVARKAYYAGISNFLRKEFLSLK